MDQPGAQAPFRQRFEWGLAGARSLCAGQGQVVAVVVDVLSFTTTVSVAADLGTTVLPYRWADASAADVALQHDAALAVGRSVAGEGEVSLSPASLRRGLAPARLVLPSPNGSTIAAHLQEAGQVCVAASLRNASAVATWIDGHTEAGTAVAVIAAGERWGDGSLRPAVEDLWGAGAVLLHLAELGWTDRSPEADLAIAAYTAVRGDEAEALERCVGGRELIGAGYRADVQIAPESEAVRARTHAASQWYRTTCGSRWSAPAEARAAVKAARSSRRAATTGSTSPGVGPTRSPAPR